MTDMLDAMTEVAYEYASNYLLGTERELLTMFLLRKEDDTFEIIGTPWRDDAEKRSMVLAVGKSIVESESRVVAFSILSGVWTAFRGPGDPMIPARQCANRKEAVMCLASDGLQRRFQAWQIGRDRQGRCVSLAAQDSSGEFESWIANLLDKAICLRVSLGKRA